MGNAHDSLTLLQCTNNPLSSGCYECDQSGRCLYCVNTILVGGVCKKASAARGLLASRMHSVPFVPGFVLPTSVGGCPLTCHWCLARMQCKGDSYCVDCNPTTLECTKCPYGSGLDAKKNCEAMPSKCKWVETCLHCHTIPLPGWRSLGVHPPGHTTC